MNLTPIANLIIGVILLIIGVILVLHGLNTPTTSREGRVYLVVFIGGMWFLARGLIPPEDGE